MNQLLLMIIRLAILLGSIYSKIVYVFFAIFGKVAKEEDLDRLIEAEGLRNKEPHELSMWLITKFSYRTDIIDYAKHYLMFLYDRKGDCDDFAAFCEVLFKKLGYSNISVVSVMAKNNAGHAVCIVERNGWVYGFGNWQIIFFNQDSSLENIGNKICEKLGDNLWFIMKYENGKYVDGLVK